LTDRTRTRAQWFKSLFIIEMVYFQVFVIIEDYKRSRELHREYFHQSLIHINLHWAKHEREWNTSRMTFFKKLRNISRTWNHARALSRTLKHNFIKLSILTWTTSYGEQLEHLSWFCASSQDILISIVKQKPRSGNKVINLIAKLSSLFSLLEVVQFIISISFCHRAIPALKILVALVMELRIRTSTLPRRATFISYSAQGR